MLPNYGDLTKRTYVNKKLKEWKIYSDQENINNERILVISDTHLTNFEETDIFIRYLSDVIKKGATMICHLGDLVDKIDDEDCLEYVFKRLDEEIDIPIYCISGNHDRSLFKRCKFQSQKKLHFNRNANAITIECSNQKIYLAHDLENSFEIPNQLAFLFLLWIKLGLIRGDNWLITGHTHTTLFSDEEKIGCIGPFSPHLDTYNYAILNLSDEKLNIKLQVEFK